MYYSNMSSRGFGFETGYVYHVFNRGINKVETFETERNYQRFLLACRFYRYKKLPFRFSYYLRAGKESQQKFLKESIKADRLVEILSYCLMPNHYHFLIKQSAEDGIIKFIGNLQNSYAKYYNLKSKRQGPLFTPKFKARQVESDEIGLHVSRYIHLNPVTANIISIEQLKEYYWSSYKEFYEPHRLDNTADISWLTHNFGDISKFFKFHQAQAHYQYILKKIYQELIDSDHTPGV